MAQNISMHHHENTAMLIIVIIVNIGHFISSSVAPIITIGSGVYVLYNIRLQIINAGGIVPYLKSWLKWKK